MFEPSTLALVTGASRGIGRACAIDLAAEGCEVLVGFNSGEDAAKEVVAAIEGAGGRARAVQVDVADERSVKSLFREIRKEHGRLDVCVNNAGIAEDGFLMMMSSRKFTSVVQTNLMGTFYCCRDALKLMAHQGSGSIVNISSASGIAGMEGQANYSASKGGIIAFTKSLAREAAGQGVRANVVAPGFIETDMTRAVPPHLIALYTSVVPLRRVGQPEEVAYMVSFLASSKASYMTGKVVVIDGGLVIG
ncbi:MAG: 3-oxoacyl-ACP reductase FabG [Actinomycetota bacterium]|nr:3-oxoacyl-ACP reductase FabG [Acidimicrobiia bacterium]MDQ3294266.1 3-oxoacyl-ACP reductase FabG [Actinomycetota bacterium]